jgi:hypothetical protein
MSEEIYNKNAREKALLEEAYSDVYSEGLATREQIGGPRRASFSSSSEPRVGSQVLWDGQRRRGQIEEIDVERNVAVVVDDDGGEHIVELDNFDVVYNEDGEEGQGEESRSWNAVIMETLNDDGAGVFKVTEASDGTHTFEFIMNVELTIYDDWPEGSRDAMFEAFPSILRNKIQ